MHLISLCISIPVKPQKLILVQNRGELSFAQINRVADRLLSLTSQRLFLGSFPRRLEAPKCQGCRVACFGFISSSLFITCKLLSCSIVYLMQLNSAGVTEGWFYSALESLPNLGPTECGSAPSWRLEQPELPIMDHIWSKKYPARTSRLSQYHGFLMILIGM